MVSCLTCNKETNNPKFCSRTCAAIYNNKHMPKRKFTKKCKTCGKLIMAARKYCKEHWPPPLKDITLKEAIYETASRTGAFNFVSSRSRALGNKLGLTKKCINCGYNKHAEIAHIRAIHTFPLNTLLSTINDPKNLIALCPNCHYEYDRGWLDITEIRKRIPDVGIEPTTSAM